MMGNPEPFFSRQCNVRARGRREPKLGKEKEPVAWSLLWSLLITGSSSSHNGPRPRRLYVYNEDPGGRNFALTVPVLRTGYGRLHSTVTVRTHTVPGTVRYRVPMPSIQFLRECLWYGDLHWYPVPVRVGLNSFQILYGSIS